MKVLPDVYFNKCRRKISRLGIKTAKMVKKVWVSGIIPNFRGVLLPTFAGFHYQLWLSFITNFGGLNGKIIGYLCKISYSKARNILEISKKL